jgi:hypothetical protein
MMGKNSIETHVIELHEKHANSAILTSKWIIKLVEPL